MIKLFQSETSARGASLSPPIEWAGVKPKLKAVKLLQPAEYYCCLISIPQNTQMGYIVY